MSNPLQDGLDELVKGNNLVFKDFILGLFDEFEAKIAADFKTGKRETNFYGADDLTPFFDAQLNNLIKKSI